MNKQFYDDYSFLADIILLPTIHQDRGSHIVNRNPVG